MRLACLRRGKKRRSLWLWDGAEEGGPAMKLAREKHTRWSNLGSTMDKRFIDTETVGVFSVLVLPYGYIDVITVTQKIKYERSHILILLFQINSY
jgi:hypothetical protein